MQWPDTPTSIHEVNPDEDILRIWTEATHTLSYYPTSNIWHGHSYRLCIIIYSSLTVKSSFASCFDNEALSKGCTENYLSLKWQNKTWMKQMNEQWVDSTDNLWPRNSEEMKKFPPVSVRGGGRWEGEEEGGLWGEASTVWSWGQQCFCAAMVTCIYSPVMTMFFKHREKRQKHKDKTASSASHRLAKQTNRRTR